MKWILIAPLLLIFPLLSASLLTDLQNYYSFEETTGAVIDSAGNNNMTNFGATTNATGIVGKAYDLEKDDSDFVYSINDIGITGAQDRSVSFWIKPESTGSFRGLVSWGTAAEDQMNLLAILTNDSLYFGGYVFDRTANNTFLNNTWHHVVETYDGTNLLLFVDGEQVSKSTKTLNTGNSKLMIGHHNITAGLTYFDGVVDELGIWTRRITQDEIIYLYNEGAGNGFSTLGDSDATETPVVVSGGGGGSSAPEPEPEQKSACAPFTYKWEEQKAKAKEISNTYEQIKIAWRAFTDYVLCRSAASIVPI